MKSIKQLLLLLKHQVEHSIMFTGMCSEVDQLVHQDDITEEEYKVLKSFLSDNTPQISQDFYKAELMLLGQGEDIWEAAEQAAKEVGHPHQGYWWEKRLKEPRIEWLDAQITRLSNES